MNTSNIPAIQTKKRFVFGILAILVSGIIAILLSKDLATPYPDLKLAYLICVGVSVAGFIQLIIGFMERP